MNTQGDKPDIPYFCSPVTKSPSTFKQDDVEKDSPTKKQGDNHLDSLEVPTFPIEFAFIGLSVGTYVLFRMLSCVC